MAEVDEIEQPQVESVTDHPAVQPEQTPPQGSKAEQLYDKLLKEGYTEKNLGDKSTFVKNVQNPMNANKLYSMLRSDGYSEQNLGDMVQFRNNLVEKKSPNGSGGGFSPSRIGSNNFQVGVPSDTRDYAMVTDPELRKQLQTDDKNAFTDKDRAELDDMHQKVQARNDAQTEQDLRTGKTPGFRDVTAPKKGGLDYLRKQKLLGKDLPKPHSWDNIGTFSAETVMSGLHKDLGQLSNFLGDAVFKGDGMIFARLGAKDLGEKLEGRAAEEQQQAEQNSLPNTTAGRLTSGAVGFVPDLIELVATPELDLGKAGQLITKYGGKYALKGAEVATGKFPTLLATKGLISGYDDAKAGGADDWDAWKKGLTDAGKGYGEGVLYEGAGRVAGKLTKVGSKVLADAGLMAGNKVVAGAQKAILNSAAQAATFSMVPFVSNAVQGKATSLDELKDNAIFGAVLGVFHLPGEEKPEVTPADVASKEIIDRSPAIDLHNFLTADPDAIEAVHNMDVTPSDLQSKSAAHAQQAFDEQDPELKQQSIVQSSLNGKMASVKAIANTILANKNDLIDGINELPISDEIKQQVIAKIEEVNKRINPAEQEKKALGAQIQNLDDAIANNQKRLQSEDPIERADAEVVDERLNKEKTGLENQLKKTISDEYERQGKASDDMQKEREQAQQAAKDVVPEEQKAPAAEKVDEKPTADVTPAEEQARLDELLTKKTPTDAEQAELGELARKKFNREAPAKPKKPRPKNKSEYAKRANKVLDNEPKSLREAILQFFVGGGKISSDDFRRFTGFSPGKDGKAFISFLKKINPLDRDSGGLPLDYIGQHHIPEQFTKGEDVSNEIIDTLQEFKGSRNDMLKELERLNDIKPETPDLTPEQRHKYGQLNDEERRIVDQMRNQEITEEEANKLLNKIDQLDHADDHIDQQKLTEQHINDLSNLLDKYTDKDGNTDWDALEKEFDQNIPSDLLNIKAIKENEKPTEAKADQDAEGAPGAKDTGRKKDSEPERQLTPTQQKVSDEYDQKIEDANKRVQAARKKIDQKLKEVSNRNNLFGSDNVGKTAGQTSAFDTELDLSDENMKSSVMKPLVEDYKAAQKEVEDLKRNKQTAIDNDSRQQRVDVQAGTMPLPFMNEFIEHDVKPVVQKLSQTFQEGLKSLVNTLSPKTGVSLNALDTITKHLNSRNEANTAIDKALGAIEKLFDKMPDEQRIDFIDRIKRGEKQPTKELQQIADAYSQMDRDLYNEVAQFKESLPFKENHFRVLWKTVPGSEKPRSWFGRAKRPLEGSKGFLKKATLTDMSEGIARGGVPLSTNPITLYKAAYEDAMKFVTAHRMFDALKEDGVIKFVKTGSEPPEGYVPIDDKIARVYFPVQEGLVKAGEWQVEKNAGRIINNFLSKDYIRDNAIGRGLMNIKNAYTAAELGLSAYHASAIALEGISSDIGRGFRKLINLGLRGDFRSAGEGITDILKAPFSPKTTFTLGRKFIKFATQKDFETSEFGKKFLKQNPEAAQYLHDLFMGGGLLKQSADLKANTYKALKEQAGKQNYIGAALRVLPALNEVMLSPLFDHYIPAMKVGMFMKEFPLSLKENQARIDKGLTTRAEVARKTVNFIDDRLGEMNFDNLFWNRTFKTSMQLMLRSVTWKLGNLRAMGGAPVEQAMEFYNAAREGRAPNLSPKMAWAMGLATMQVALATTTQYMFTGTYPQSFKDLIAPRLSTDDNKDRMVLPTYTKDLTHLYYKGARDYVASSLSGDVSKLADIWANSDFQKYQIYSPDEDITQNAKDVGLYVLPKPISVSALQQSIKKGDPASRMAMSFFGFNKAPRYLTNPPIENKIFDLYTMHEGVKSKGQKEANEIKQQIKDLYKQGKDDDAEKLINDALESGKLKYSQIKYLNREVGKGESAATYFFNELPDDDKVYLYKQMTEEEKQTYDPKGKVGALVEQQEEYQKEQEAKKKSKPFSMFDK